MHNCIAKNNELELAAKGTIFDIFIFERRCLKAKNRVNIELFDRVLSRTDALIGVISALIAASVFIFSGAGKKGQIGKTASSMAILFIFLVISCFVGITIGTHGGNNQSVSLPNFEGTLEQSRESLIAYQVAAKHKFYSKWISAHPLPISLAVASVVIHFMLIMDHLCRNHPWRRNNYFESFFSNLGSGAICMFPYALYYFIFSGITGLLISSWDYYFDPTFYREYTSISTGDSMVINPWSFVLPSFAVNILLLVFYAYKLTHPPKPLGTGLIVPYSNARIG